MLNVHLIVLSLAIATSYAALSHLLWGEALRDLFVYWIAALVGFGMGQLLAVGFSWHDVYPIGELHLVTASVICWLCLILAKQLKL